MAVVRADRSVREVANFIGEERKSEMLMERRR